MGNAVVFEYDFGGIQHCGDCLVVDRSVDVGCTKGQKGKSVGGTKAGSMNIAISEPGHLQIIIRKPPSG